MNVKLCVVPFTNQCHKLLLFPEYGINCMYCVERGIIETGRSTLFRRRMSNSCRKYGCVCSVWGCVALNV